MWDQYLTNVDLHWNQKSQFDNIFCNKNVILKKCSSLVTLEVVILTTSSVASDENFIKMTF